MNQETEFEWNPAKAEANLRKHKVPFVKAIEIFKDPMRVERPDESEVDGEDRWLVLGSVEQRILLVVLHLARPVHPADFGKEGKSR